MAFAEFSGMRTVTLPLPELGFTIATRAALAAGLGLFFAERIPPERRRQIGLALVAVGAATTIPIARWLSHGLHQRGIESDTRHIGGMR